VNTDAGTIRQDPFESWADLTWSGEAALAVWIDDRRDLSFQMPRRRGPDLWSNALLPDGGLLSQYGQILCLAAKKETFSEPRIASNETSTLVAWRVETAGRAGHTVRVATIGAGGVQGCTNTVVEAATPISSLQLAESNGEFLLLWETGTDVTGQFVVMPAQPAFTVWRKPAFDVAALPTLTSTASGFFAAWSQGETFWGVSIPSRASGLPAQTPQPYFQNFFPRVAHATAFNSPLGGAFLAPYLGAPHVFAGPINFGSTANLVSPGPVAGPHPLVAAGIHEGTPWRAMVAHQVAEPGQFAVTEFGPGPVTSALPAGHEPLAMVANTGRAVLLMETPSALSFLSITPGTLNNGRPLGTGTGTFSSPDQLRPSAAWTDAGVWLIASNQGPSLQGAQLDPMTGAVTGITETARDGGTFTLEQVAAGPRVAVKVVGNRVTSVFLAEFGTGGVTGTHVMSGVGEHPAALVGENIAAVWSPGEAYLVAGRGTPAAQPWTGARFGRCGAWADGSLFIPLLKDGALSVLEIADDAAAPTATLHNLGALGRASPPCLVARGNDLLLVADDTDTLVVATTTVAELRADAPMRPVVLQVSRPGNRNVASPVAAPTPRGWQLAWESPDDFATVILGMKLDLDGAVRDGNLLSSSGLEARAPVLVPSFVPSGVEGSNGAVVLLWQHFVDRTGSVEARQRVLQQEPALVIAPPPDAGQPTDVFVYDTMCGCQSGGPAVLALALLVFFTRRRRRDAPPRS
jgi:MYXO-CTERM domain-containing protein